MTGLVSLRRALRLGRASGGWGVGCTVAKEDQVNEVVPGVVDGGDEQEQDGAGDAEEGSAGVGARGEGCGGQPGVGSDWQQCVEEPVFEDRVVVGLGGHAIDGDGNVNAAGQAAELPSEGCRGETGPGHGERGGEEQDGDEVDDVGAGEGVGGAGGRTGGEVGEQRHGDELEAGERGGGRAYDLGKDLPIG